MAAGKGIHPLPDDVKAFVRTGVALTSFAQAVEELVLNSIDAGATNIAVRVDLPYFKVQVIDNGSGISLDGFNHVGDRYSTSKCHSAQDLENLHYFGYRGEALASLASAASFLEITSRTSGSRMTYTKPFHKGKPQPLVQASAPRPCHGTTVTAFDLFHNLPVRRKRLSEALEMEGIRYRVSGIALMWPSVSVSLRDDSVGHVILQTHKCSGVAAAFSSIFTPARARKLLEVDPVQREEFKISGLVSIEGYSRKDLQFVFVNRRLVLKSSIHKQVNKILGRSLILKRKGLNSDITAKLPVVGDDNGGSPTKQGERYGIFVINIECPFKAYDITFDPAKTLVEFRDWPKLIHLLQDMLYPFLRKHNLLAWGETLTPLLSGELDAGNGEDCHEDASSESSERVRYPDTRSSRPVSQLQRYGRNICITDTQHGILSKSVHRPRKPADVEATVQPDTVSKRGASGTTAKSSQIERPEKSIELKDTPASDLSECVPRVGLISGDGRKNYTCTADADRSQSQRNLKFLGFSSATVESHPHPEAEVRRSSCAVKHQQVASGHEVNAQLPNQTSLPKNKAPASQLIEASSSKETCKEVRFDVFEDELPLPPLPPPPTEQQSLKRKEIRLSPGSYCSTLQSLRKRISISGDSNSGHGPKETEIITDTLQQLRRSVNEMGDRYKTPEKVTSRRRSSDKCEKNGAAVEKRSKVDISSSDAISKGNTAETEHSSNKRISFEVRSNGDNVQPSMVKHAKAGCVSSMTIDESSNYDPSSVRSKNRFDESRHIEQDLDELFRADIEKDTGQSRGLPYDQPTSSRHLLSCVTSMEGDGGRCPGNIEMQGKSSNSFHRNFSKERNIERAKARENLNDVPQSSIRETPTETDRQSVTVGGLKSLLKPLRATQSSETFPLQHNSSEPDLPNNCAFVGHLQGKRKSPQKLTQSTKLAKLMRGEVVSTAEEGNSHKSFFQGFQYKRQNKNEFGERKDSKKARQPTPVFDNSHRLSEETENSETASKRNVPIVANQNVSDDINAAVSTHTFERMNDSSSPVELTTLMPGLSNPLYNSNASCNSSAHTNISQQSNFKNHCCSTHKESVRPRLQCKCQPASLCSSSSPSTETQGEGIPCCHCIHLRHIAKHACCKYAYCKNSCSSHKDLPFSKFSSPANIVTPICGESQPRVSVILSLPLDQRQPQRECACASGKEHSSVQPQPPGSATTNQSNSEALSETKEVFVEAVSGSGVSQKSEGLSVSCQESTLSLTTAHQDKEIASHARDDSQSLSPPPLLSQGFPVHDTADLDSKNDDSYLECGPPTLVKETIYSENPPPVLIKENEVFTGVAAQSATTQTAFEGDCSSSHLSQNNCSPSEPPTLTLGDEECINPLTLSGTDSDLYLLVSPPQEQASPSRDTELVPTPELVSCSSLVIAKGFHSNTQNLQGGNFFYSSKAHIHVDSNDEAQSRCNAALSANVTNQKCFSHGHISVSSTAPSNNDAQKEKSPSSPGASQLKEDFTRLKNAAAESEGISEFDSKSSDQTRPSGSQTRKHCITGQWQIKSVEADGCLGGNEGSMSNPSTSRRRWVSDAKSCYFQRQESLNSAMPGAESEPQRDSLAETALVPETLSQNAVRDEPEVVADHFVDEIILEKENLECDDPAKDMSHVTQQKSKPVVCNHSLASISDITSETVELAPQSVSDFHLSHELADSYPSIVCEETYEKQKDSLNTENVANAENSGSWPSCSLTLAQRPGKHTEECDVAEDSDSFSFLHKTQAPHSSSADPTKHNPRDESSSRNAELDAMEGSESLFGDSEKLLGNLATPGGDYNTAIVTDSSAVHGDESSNGKTLVHQTPASAKRSSNKEAKSESIPCDGILEQTRANISDHQADGVEEKNAKARLPALSMDKLKDGSADNTLWSSGDQALLMLELPGESPTQSPSVASAEQSHRAPITVSSHLGFGLLTSSLSLLREHATGMVETQGPNRLQEEGHFCLDSDKHTIKQTSSNEMPLPIDQSEYSNGVPINLDTEGHVSLDTSFSSPDKCTATIPHSDIHVPDGYQGHSSTFPSDHNDCTNITERVQVHEGEDHTQGVGEGHESLGCTEDHGLTAEPTAQSVVQSCSVAEACWRQEVDSLTGRKLYVNNQSGHTITEDQWPVMSSQSLREMTKGDTTAEAEDKGEELPPLSASGRQVLAEVISSHMEEADVETESKWRGGRKFTYEKEAGMDISTLLAKWNNPTFLNYKPPSVEAEACPTGAVAKSCFNSLSMVEFTKGMLENVKVIGQVDNKFIACEIMQTKCKAKGVLSSLLVLFDQHAVHERVRLEYYTQNCYVAENGEKTNRLQDTAVVPPQTVTMNQDDVRILRAFSREFARIGVTFTLDEASRSTVRVTSIPACLQERELAVDVRRRRAMSLEEKTECLIKEHIDLLKSTNGACGRLPMTVHKHLCSLACHGAVKFGDKLTLPECRDLLSALSRCDLPFQCAHGRPSVAPIIDLTALEEELSATVKKMPRFWKISGSSR